MYTIGKQFTFDAAHRLENLPDGHKCGGLHGHTYTVELRLSYPGLDHKGMVMDFGDMAEFKQMIDTIYDHRFLNEIMLENPTAENIARDLHAVATNLYPRYKIKVRVWETPKAWAEYGQE